MSVEQLRTIEEAAKVLTMSVDTVRLLVESGQLPYVDMASRAYKDKRVPTPKRARPTTRFRDEDLQAFILARRVAATRGPLTSQPAPELEAPIAPDERRRPSRPPTLNLPGADRYVS